MRFSPSCIYAKKISFEIKKKQQQHTAVQLSGTPFSEKKLSELSISCKISVMFLNDRDLQFIYLQNIFKRIILPKSRSIKEFQAK